MNNSKEENQNFKGKPSVGIISLIVILSMVIVVLLAILLFSPKDNKEIMVKEKEDKLAAYNSTQNNISEINENNSIYYIGSTTNNTENVVNQNNNQNTEKEDKPSNNVKNPYEKYSNSNLEWYFDKKLTELDGISANFVIENNVLYLEKNGEKKKLNSINEKVKYITGWGEVTLQSIYVLTEVGSIWKIGNNYDKDELYNMIYSGNNVDEFKKLNFSGKVINMTDGDFSTRIVEGPYFLLDNGELINEDGSKYKELEGNFTKRFGTIKGTIFVTADNTIYEYNDETRKYIQIKDNNGKSIKLTTRMTSIFIQSPNIRNNLETKNSTDRIIIVTEDNKLLYFDGYENVTPKEYEGSIGKTVKNAVVNEIPDEYGGHTNNARIIFSDGTEITLIDVYKAEPIC